MDRTKLKKPQNLTDDVWDQHLDWMDVMGKQVDENYRHHLRRVEEDASRSESLASHHDEVQQAQRVKLSLFSHPKH
ncbi:MAG: hypothetical protein ACPG1A_07755 [Halioglobus sp.]